MAVRNLNEISGVLRNILERRRGRLIWPGKEEDVINQLILGSHRENIPGQTRPALRSGCSIWRCLAKALPESFFRVDFMCCGVLLSNPRGGDWQA